MEAGGGLVRLLRTRGETDWLLREVDPVLRILGWENARVVTAQTFFERLSGLLAPVYGAPTGLPLSSHVVLRYTHGS